MGIAPVGVVTPILSQKQNVTLFPEVVKQNMKTYWAVTQYQEERTTAAAYQNPHTTTSSHLQLVKYQCFVKPPC